jgi:hypothetical protein
MQKEISKYSAAYKRQHVESLLATRLKKLGSITTMQAFEICREHYTYGVVAEHFKSIMCEMITAGNVDKIANGTYWIYNNKKTNHA